MDILVNETLFLFYFLYGRHSRFTSRQKVKEMIQFVAT